ncbi:MAG: serine/threonine protein kinase [Deltaproteobacteria bacterium]|nr:serine/threonine protein kinase [Deltaproteobacteria bacterium]
MGRDLPDAGEYAEKRRFHIQRCLGRGGFGEVYLATMISGGGVRSDVAVKVLHQGLDPKSQAVRRLRDEGRLLGYLNHPGILRVYDLVLLEERVALVTEFVDGADLDECYQAKPPPSVRALLEVTARVAEALHAAYTTEDPSGRALHLVHRDIKPANIRISHHGDVRLLDFGIAKARDAEREARTETNAVVGSLLYLAPERLDDAPIGPTSDMYGLGATLFEALIQERFFQDLTVKQQYRLAFEQAEYERFLQGRLERLSGLPRPVCALVGELLRYDPEVRPTAYRVSRQCDDLVEMLGGATLRRWCQDRVWPQQETEYGPLDGRVITESTLTGHQRTDETTWIPRSEGEARATGGTSTRTFALIGAAGVALLALLVGVGVVCTGLLWPFSQDLAEVAPAEPEPPPPPPREDTAVEPVAAPEPSPPPKPPPVRPRTRPVVPEPEPAIIAVTGSKTPVLRGGGTEWSPGEVPPGSYEIWVDFGEGMRRYGTVVAEAGRTATVSCNPIRHECGVVE